jgi:hypothetical protein
MVWKRDRWPHMTFFKNKSIYGVIGLILLAISAVSGKEWASEANLMNIVDFVVLDDYVYKYQKGNSQLGIPRGFYQSTDMVTWESQLNLDMDIEFGELLIKHDDRLYFFEGHYCHMENEPSKIHHLGTGTNGAGWRSIPNPIGTLCHDSLKDAISFNGDLYVSIQGHPILKIKGVSAAGTTLNYSLMQGPAETSPDTLFVFLNRLHAVVTSVHYVYGDGWKTTSHIYRSPDGDTWESEPVASFFWDSSNSVFARIVAVHNNQIYLGVDNLWRTVGTQTINKKYVNWEKVDYFLDKQNAVPFNASGRLHVLIKDQPLMILSPEGQWEPGSQKVSRMTLPKRASHSMNFNGKVYVPLESEIWSVESGVLDVRFKPILQDAVLRGPQRAGVLGFSFESNYGDIAHLKVTNRESAVHGEDIQAVHLLRVMGGDALYPRTEVIGELQPDSQDPLRKTWMLPTPVHLGEKEDLLIAIDVAPTAQAGRKVQMVIAPENLTFEGNSLFRIPTELIGFPITMKEAVEAAGPPPNAEVLVYPQPAQDRVWFQYDLDSASDVTVKIFNRKGRLISELKDPGKTGSLGQTIWNAATIGPGTYYAHIKIQPQTGPPRQFTQSVFIK